MTLELCGHDFKYETEQIVLLFFPSHEGVFLKSRAYMRDGKYVVESTARADGNEAEYTEAALCETKKEMANAVKRSAYFAFLKISPLDAPWGILTGIRPAKPLRTMLEEGISREEIAKILKAEYLVSDKKIRLGLEIAEKELRLISKNPKDVSVYIGIPFCPSRCVYCSFISHDAVKMAKLVPLYAEKICLEIQKAGEIIKALGLTLRSVYLGGGTPTALDINSLKAVTEAISVNLSPGNTMEYTAEAGRPDTITHEKLEILKNAGVSRISINPQSAHDKTLETIGRNHSFDDFLKAFALARSMGFKNINCDLIAGLPGETLEDFKFSLDTITKLAPESITVHTLYIKRASFLKNSDIPLPAPSEAALMVDYAMNKCTDSGYRPYYLYKQKSTLGNLENVGFSKKGCECVYNIDTMSDSCSILALGAGGVSKVYKNDRIERVFNFKNADDYIYKFDEIMKRKDDILKLFRE